MEMITKGSIVALKNKKKQYALEQEFKVPFSVANTGEKVLVVDANGEHVGRMSIDDLEISSGEKTQNDFIRPASIEIGGLSKEKLIKKIKDGLKIDNCFYNLCIASPAEDIVMDKNFTVLPEKKTVKLIYRTVADMGFTAERTKLSEIRDFIKTHYKSEFCDNETALWLRLIWDRITYNWVYITTKLNSKDLPPDNPYIFHFCGNYLYHEEVNKNFTCDLKTLFIFSE